MARDVHTAVLGLETVGRWESFDSSRGIGSRTRAPMARLPGALAPEFDFMIVLFLTTHTSDWQELESQVCMHRVARDETQSIFHVCSRTATAESGDKGPAKMRRE